MVIFRRLPNKFTENCTFQGGVRMFNIGKENDFNFSDNVANINRHNLGMGKYIEHNAFKK